MTNDIARPAEEIHGRLRTLADYRQDNVVLTSGIQRLQREVEQLQANIDEANRKIEDLESESIWPFLACMFGALFLATIIVWGCGIEWP